MIRSLCIENIAVVKSLCVELGGGMTVLSGETGAGKSIIIDSLGLLLGAKADKDLIRSGEESARVSAVFEDVGESALELLRELGFECEDGSVMLSRALTHSSSTARINGKPVTAAMLREVGTALFNIHGQNDNAQLLDSKNHVRLLDAYAQNTPLFELYGERYRDMLARRIELDSFKKDTMEQARLSEMLAFHVRDIDSARLKEGEEETLCELVRRLESIERISKATSLVSRAIKGGEKNMGAEYLCERAASALDSISDTVPEAAELSERLNSVRYELEDIAECARELADVGDGDPTAQLDRAQARLDVITKLKRKYGSSISEILSYREDCARRLDAIENADERLGDLERELKDAEASARMIADKLTEKRRESAKRLSTAVCDTLTFLDMPKVRFEVCVKKADVLSATGGDRVEFLISTNPGEPLMPLEKIASGGELARIMLSLKNVLNECDGVRTVIFDEVDTGISGKTSRKVGIKLKEIGTRVQVLCVTHSAQIASLAHEHLLIYKTEENGRVQASLKALSRDGRREEISRILGGIEITEAVRRAADEMLSEGESY